MRFVLFMLYTLFLCSCCIPFGISSASLQKMKKKAAIKDASRNLELLKSEFEVIQEKNNQYPEIKSNNGDELWGKYKLNYSKEKLQDVLYDLYVISNRKGFTIVARPKKANDVWVIINDSMVNSCNDFNEPLVKTTIEEVRKKSLVKVF